MRIAVTGAAGLIGAALVRSVPGAVGLGHRDLDITDRSAVREVLGRLRPDVVFNCAVIGVDDCERDRQLANRVNVLGPGYLAEAAPAIVHFSSNYVFDGVEQKDYTVEDEPRPLNEYGRTKLEGERAVAAANQRAFIVRTSWVFGRGKESFLATAPERLRERKTLRAITDTFAATTYVEDLVPRVLEVIERGVPGTYHLVNAGVCSYETFALEAARILGADESLIERISERDMRREAPRPRYTPMRCLLSERLGLAPLRPWQEALAEYVSR